MSGPAPKPAHLRRRRNAPAGGDWVDLLELEAPVLPALPEGDWSEYSIAMWDAWRADRATSQYTPADIGYALETIRIADTSTTADQCRSSVSCGCEWTASGSPRKASATSVGVSPTRPRRWPTAAWRGRSVWPGPCRRDAGACGQSTQGEGSRRDRPQKAAGWRGA
jgi:hypothetical protein